MKIAIKAGLSLLALFVLFDKFLVANWQPFLLLVPRFEPLYDESSPETVCVFPNLAPQSVVIVLAESDHDQWEHFADARALYGFPWRRPELTARFEQQVQVLSVILGDAQLQGQSLRFFHHMETRGMVGCSLRQGILQKGHYVVFLKRTESGQFRLTRDRLAGTLDLPKGDYGGLRPDGATAETRILSIFFEQAKRQPEQAREVLSSAFNLIRYWELESESVHFWKEWLATNPEAACEAGLDIYWWELDACLKSSTDETRWRNGQLWKAARQDWLRDRNDWRRRTIARYGTIIAARLEHKLLIY